MAESAPAELWRMAFPRGGRGTSYLRGFFSGGERTEMSLTESQWKSLLAGASTFFSVLSESINNFETEV